MNKSKARKENKKTESELPSENLRTSIVDPSMREWKKVDWRKLEKRVFKLQKRIYKASERGDVKAVRKLQKMVIRSWSCKMLAVRRVTQDNTGKKTAGVDGVKSLTPKQRFALVARLKLGSKSRPTRRVFIPKANGEKRPLGIPTMNDRALQALVKLALEPEWEARFEPNSYGFRPGRSAHDAIGAIFNAIRYKAKYVLDADIAKCFDCIDHKALLEKVNTFPTISRQLLAWLKAGVMEDEQFQETSKGTPQGGVVSPLLANIALHGMEERIKRYAVTLPGGKENNQDSLSLIRYADDFVILHKDLTVVLRCQQIIAEWLKEVGLELKPSKTRLTHTLNKHGDEEIGFDFLGFNIRQFPVGKYNSGRNGQGKSLGFKTIITPSSKKVKEHYQQIVETINAHKTAPQSALIGNLYPIIRGWANYYSTVCSKETYSYLNKLVYEKLWSWAKSRHPNKSREWIVKKYWQTIGGDNWTFATPQNGKNPMWLQKHSETSIVRHVKVKSEASPYDGNLVYWSKRKGEHPEMPIRVAKLLKQQKGKCQHCGLYFREEDAMEVDHIIPRKLGGKDQYNNLQLLHKHCHDTKTTGDGSVGSTQEKCQLFEEPDERKLSRLVLKTSGSRKGIA